MEALKRRYLAFTELLNANNEALKTIAELESLLLDPQFLTSEYIKARCAEISENVSRMIRSLEHITNEDYQVLHQIFEEVATRISEVLSSQTSIEVRQFTLPLASILPEMRGAIGSKNAHLAEMRSLLSLRVPDGFAITTLAYQRFYDHNRLASEIKSLGRNITVDDAQTIQEASDRIQALINNQGEFPKDLKESLMESYLGMKQRYGSQLRVAVRSSAIGEDSAHSSFAGLYESHLNVKEEEFLDAYRKVLASKYSPRAMYYNAKKGIRDEDIPMCACCIQMVDAVRSGVMYTQDPFSQDRIVINAGWGLGPSIASGEVSPDTYVLDKKSGRVLEKRISPQPWAAIPGTRPGHEELSSSRIQSREPCLSDKDLIEIFLVARLLERHYGRPQDVEFSFDESGRLWLLQTRPLRCANPSGPSDGSWPEPPEEKIIASFPDGETACTGLACGVAYVVLGKEDMARFPASGVIIARKLFPEWIELLGRVKAIVTEIGSPTGHMASIAREFRVPMIVNAHRALEKIPAGEWITVDAFNRIIYHGQTEAVSTAETEPTYFFNGSPEYAMLRQVIAEIAPLNLTNPRDASFSLSSCRTFHDIMRFCHEEAINSMFNLNGPPTLRHEQVFKINVPIPLNIYVVDLGGGIRGGTYARKEIMPEDLASTPMKALLDGMMTEGVTWAGHVPIGVKGFISVFANTLYDPMKYERDLGERSYAIVSAQYVNFSSRLGYHFSNLDAYCAEETNSNYISFRFKGGAASLDRRERRGQFIARILTAYDFRVDQEKDVVDAEFKKYSLSETLDRLHMLGRLMGCARQLDVVMESGPYVDHFVGLFLQGHYDFFKATLPPKIS